MAEIPILLRHAPVSTIHCTAFGFNAKQERKGRIEISAIGRCDLVVAAAAWNPPPPLCCCSMFRVVTAGRR